MYQSYGVVAGKKTFQSSIWYVVIMMLDKVIVFDRKMIFRGSNNLSLGTGTFAGQSQKHCGRFRMISFVYTAAKNFAVVLCYGSVVVVVVRL